ncbi:MAG: dTDP-4-dehydrorhamnose 3,5-epimerase family protein [Balneolaceae bacterium]|nr:dTDP-4-dehydrorhamnose 3,5-epimerase family protein [Balneolaceae bacterium]
MIFNETEIAGAYIIDIEKFEDDRGFFARGYCENEFKDQGISFRPVQANIGYSRQKYTLRGLHSSEAPTCRSQIGALYERGSL